MQLAWKPIGLLLSLGLAIILGACQLSAERSPSSPAPAEASPAYPGG